MKYTGPKMKLCRREQTNLFGPIKYDIKKNRNVPGPHGKNMQRYSEYGKLLRNKQTFKRRYLLTEKQFVRIVKKLSAKYSKNNNISHDVALFQFLEKRIDVVVLNSGLATTIMQARQMVNHGHVQLNGVKHDIPSTFLKVGDVVTVRKHLHTSPLYAQAWANTKFKTPSWINVNKKNFSIELVDLPTVSKKDSSGDLLKVIEFYARA